MNKTVHDTSIVYSQSRRILLGLIVPLPALFIIGNQLEMSVDALPILVTGIMALGGLALGLTHEKLTLDLATRSGVYETVFAGVSKKSRSFSFDAVVGCLVIDTVPKEYRDGQERTGGATIFHVAMLYRDANGKLAEQIKIGSFGNKDDAMAEAQDITNKLGGQVYFKEDLPALEAMFRH